jgi:hypothetical protein
MLTNLDVLNALSQLPALTPIESAVAKAWLNEHGTEYDAVSFNVRLGSGVVLPPGSPDYIQKFARAATTKRADMILFRGKEATIVEVKIRIGGSALGQLTVYRNLFLADHPEFTTVHLIAAGQTIEPDVEAIFRQHAITVETFPGVQV